MESPTERRGHSIWKIILIVLHIIVVIVGIIFSFYFTGVDSGVQNNQNSSGHQAMYTEFFNSTNETGLTPAAWTFTVWFVIYAWKVLSSLYAASTIFRKNHSGEYLYNASSSHIHFSYYIVYILSEGVLMGWTVVAGMDQFILMFVFLLVTSLMIFICGFIVCWSLEKAGATLEKSGLAKDIWMTRMFMINGLSFYGTWYTVSTLTNLLIVFVYVANVDMTTGCWITLIILTVTFFVWFVLETFIFDRYLRYVFSQYIALFVTFTGLLSEHWKDPIPSYIYYTAALFGAAGILGIVKFIVMIANGRRNPISYTNVMISEQKTGLEMKP